MILQNKKVHDLAEGRELIAQIDDAISVSIRAMKLAVSNEEWNFSSNQHYQLKIAKRNIQAQMGKIVKEQRNAS